MLITGGLFGDRNNLGGLKSAEIYHPDTNSTCTLPDLPEKYYGHTQDGSLLCGGRAGKHYFGSIYCRRWNNFTGTWDKVSRSLIESRLFHVSWTPADGSGTYLIGGDSVWKNTTYEVFEKDTNKVNATFPMQYVTV